MKHYFRTESGSTYEINDITLEWARLRDPAVEGDLPLRTKGGRLVAMPNIVKGHGVTMFGAPIDPQADLRMINTTPVVEYLQAEGSLIAALTSKEIMNVGT